MPPPPSLLLRGVALAAVLASPPSLAQWTPVGGVPQTDVSRVVATGDTLVAGVGDRVYVSTDRGASWQASAPLDPDAVFIDALAVVGDTLYAGSGPLGIFRSADLGASWSEVNEGLAGYNNAGRFPSAFARRGDYLFVGTEDAVYRMDLRDPVRWEHYSDGFFNSASTINALTGRGDRLAASAGQSGYVLVNDGAPGWQPAALEPPGPSPDLYASAFAWLGDTLLAATRYGVYRSEDTGSTWEVAGLAAAMGYVNALAVGGGTVFWATQRAAGSSLYRSEDGGATWTLETVMPHTFDLLAYGGRLYASRMDGLWVRDLTTPNEPVGKPAGASPALEAVYPSPARGPVQVVFRLGVPGEVVVRVVDLTGREVARLADGYYPAGAHPLVWEPEQGAGAYVVWLTGEAGSASRRVVVVR